MCAASGCIKRYIGVYSAAASGVVVQSNDIVCGAGHNSMPNQQCIPLASTTNLSRENFSIWGNTGWRSKADDNHEFVVG